MLGLHFDDVLSWGCNRQICGRLLYIYMFIYLAFIYFSRLGYRLVLNNLLFIFGIRLLYISFVNFDI